MTLNESIARFEPIYGTIFCIFNIMMQSYFHEFVIKYYLQRVRIHYYFGSFRIRLCLLLVNDKGNCMILRLNTPV